MFCIQTTDEVMEPVTEFRVRESDVSRFYEMITGMIVCAGRNGLSAQIRYIEGDVKCNHWFSQFNAKNLVQEDLEQIIKVLVKEVKDLRAGI